MHDAIIVGSGPAGTAAALQLAGSKILMLDVGSTPSGHTSHSDGDFFAVRKNADASFESLIGQQFESLINLVSPQPVNLKLKAPFMKFIIDRGQELAPISTDNFAGVISLAKGGLANGWGAGVYRFTGNDLQGYPFTYPDLAPFYDTLVRHIGVSGENDDLQPWFGTESNLQPALEQTEIAAQLLSRYTQRKADLNSRGLYIGKTRLAVLSEQHQGRSAYRFDRMEFFRPHNPAIYTPVYTLDRLIAEGLIDYQPGWIVKSFRELDSHVEVLAQNTRDGSTQHFVARKLLLAAGALNSARIVLNSAGDTRTRLPIMDNPLSAFPLLRPDRLGTAMDAHDTSFGQLNMIFQQEAALPLQSTIYGINGALRSDAIFDLPLPYRAGTHLFRQACSAALLVLTFHPGIYYPQNYLRLSSGGALEINYEPDTCIGEPEKKMIRLLRGIGYLGHGKLIKAAPMGSSLHFAGILPMRQHPGQYQCAANGQLTATRHVHIVDGACLPALPAKNLTLTIMANAMRIASRLVFQERGNVTGQL